MTSTRALFLCPFLDAGGAEKHWQSLLPGLREVGVDVRLVAIGGGGRALEALRADGIEVRELGGQGIPGALRKFPALLKERQWKPTVIVSWTYNAHALGAMFARATSTPHVVNWHRQPGFVGTRVQEGTLQFAGTLGAGAIAVSDSQLDDLKGLRFNPDRLRVVWNGVAAPQVESKEVLRARLGLPADALVCVLVARLRAEKRVEDFVAAMAGAARESDRVVGVVVGDGPEDTNLRRRAEELGAPVQFAGYQSDPSRYVLASDVVYLTSDFEALPMALIEAGAAGRACVTTDTGGTREIVEDGVTGFVVAPGDITGLVDATVGFATDPARADAMGAAALERWRDRFTFDQMIAQYAELLGNVSGPPTLWG